MIFLTVGTQLPFERLVKALDEWAKDHADVPVFAQIGETEYKPLHMEYVERIDPHTYKEKFEQASLVVSHVGMGTIISGLEQAKPLVLMPRLAALGEHRNDHQLGTAKKFVDRQTIDIVENIDDLYQAIDARLNRLSEETELTQLETSESLLNKIAEFIEL